MMETKKCFLTQVIFCLSVVLLIGNFAQAETTNCTAITSLPYTISTKGNYCLAGSLATAITSGNAITINADDVVLDLNGYKIGGGAAGAGTNAFGIYAYQQKNITIRNGTVRGFRDGITLFDDSPYTTSQGHIIEDIRADRNTRAGIFVYGRGNIIRNNLVVGSGGSSVITSPIGIHVLGPGNRVINNDIYETKEQAGAIAYGILGGWASGLVVENNRVGNIAFGPGTSYGIYMVASNAAMVKDNTISVMNYGIYYNSTSTGIYMNNLVSGCTNAFTGGMPAGSTNFYY